MRRTAILPLLLLISCGTNVDSGPFGSGEAPSFDLGAEPDLGLDLGVDLGLDLGIDLGAEPDGGVAADLGADLGPDASAPDGGMGDAGIDMGPPPGRTSWSWASNGQRSLPNRFQIAARSTELLLSLTRGPTCSAQDQFYGVLTNSWREQERLTNQSAFGALLWADDRWLSYGGGNCGLNAFSQDRGFRLDPISGGSDVIRSRLGGREDFQFHLLANELVILGGRTEGDIEPPLEPGARFDLLDDSWELVEETGFPDAPFSSAASDAEIVTWGADSANRAIYDLANDAWRALTPPPFQLGAGPLVWTGQEVFVWDGERGALYDPTTDNWRRTSSLGAPSGTGEAKVVWADREVVVLAENGGAHYLPATDQWFPIEETESFLPARETQVVWTGQEILLLGARTSSSNMLSGNFARYGPRWTGTTTTCLGKDGPLGVGVSSPTTRQVASGMLELVGEAVSDTAVLSVEWRLDGQSVAQTLEANVDLSGLGSQQVFELVFEAEDAAGRKACLQRSLRIDELPEIRVIAPAEGQISSDGLVDFEIECVDDLPDCQLAAFVVDGGLDAVAIKGGPTSFSSSIDLSSFDGETVMLGFRAVDAVNQRVEAQQRTVGVELSAALVDPVQLSESVCDVEDDRVLWVDDSDRFNVRDLLTGTDFLVTAVPNGTPNCADSRLLPADEIVVRINSRAYRIDGTGTLLEDWPTTEQRAQGGFIAVRTGSTLERRDLVSAAVDVLESNAASRGRNFGMAQNGAAVWMDALGNVRGAMVGAMTRDLELLSPAPRRIEALGGSDFIAWSEPNGPDFQLRVWDGAAVVSVSPAQFPSSGPVREDDFFARGPWLGFTEEDVTGRRQVWRWSAATGRELVTGFVDDTSVRGVSGGGDILYRRAGRLVHWNQATQIHTDIARDLGLVHPTSTEFRLQIGPTLFRVVP
ncbi:MAG: hypothetical protein AAGD10_03280 [Myxococcota bacterium]